MFPRENLTGNLPVWSEQERNDTVENTVKHIILLHDSAAGARSVLHWFIVTSVVEGLVGRKFFASWSDDLSLWLW